MRSSLALKRCNLFNDLLAEQIASEYVGAVDCGPLEVDLDTASEASAKQASSATRAEAHDLLCEVCPDGREHLKLSLGAR